MRDRRTLVATLVLLAALCVGVGFAVAGWASASTAPVAGLDHWRSPYGVWSCQVASDDDPDGWLPHFSSWDDPLGIHSHDDGVISIHPFVPEAAGENAVVGHFFAAMRAELTDDALVLADGTVLDEAVPCADGRQPVLHIRRWSDLAMDGAPVIVTEALAGERFRNNHEVWLFVFAPIDAQLAPLPQERLDAAW